MIFLNACFWGRGALAKVKGGAKRKIKVKREFLLTGMSGVVIPSRHSRTFFVPVPITTRWLLYQMATYVISK